MTMAKELITICIEKYSETLYKVGPEDSEDETEAPETPGEKPDAEDMGEGKEGGEDAGYKAFTSQAAALAYAAKLLTAAKPQGNPPATRTFGTLQTR